MSSKVFLLLVVTALFTRFFGINWDAGYFSHPDENNMASALSQLSDTNLNPHFFAYGQFPLYLGYFTLKIINIPNTFANSIYVLRFYSAIFSLLFLYYAYLLSTQLFKNKFVESSKSAFGGNAKHLTGENKLFKNLHALLFVLLLIFSPGLIQIAHFGTTESLLSFVFIANLYYLLRIYKKPKFKFFVISAILSGFALGSKVTAVFFIWPIILIGIFKKELLSTFFFILATGLLFLATSPYNFIDINDFLSSMQYESGVANGSLEVFYTRQFLNTTPYLFQFTHIFPYVLGLPVFIFGILGILSLPLGRAKSSPLNYLYLSIILIPSLIYFIYFGQLFVKWTRFMSPIFFIFPLFATYYISRLRPIYHIPYTIFCLLPGLFFMSQYFSINPRVSTSNWINSNLPQNSTILSESGNVVDLKLRPDINVINFDFYTLDNNYQSKISLDTLLSTSDYVLVPSRRVFKNQNNFMFPYSQEYYQQIFSDKYKLVYKSFGRGENAEETFTVFDYPTIRIFKKLKINNL